MERDEIAIKGITAEVGLGFNRVSSRSIFDYSIKWAKLKYRGFLGVVGYHVGQLHPASSVGAIFKPYIGLIFSMTQLQHGIS